MYRLWVEATEVASFASSMHDRLVDVMSAESYTWLLCDSQLYLKRLH